MPAEILITEIIDVNNSVNDLGVVMAEIEKMEQIILKVNKNPINLQGVSGMKELREAAVQLTQSLNQLNTTVSGLSKTNTSKVFIDQAKSIDVATDATQENTLAQKENLTWQQFVGQRMGQYMKIYGDHATAIKQISKEWNEYKLTGQSVVQTSNEIAAAQRKETTAISEKETVLAGLNEKYQQATVLAKNLADQFGADSIQAQNAARSAAQLKDQIEQLNATKPADSTPNISAYEQLKKEVKEAEINAKNLATQFGIDSEQALQAARSYEILRTKLAEINSVTKLSKAPSIQDAGPNIPLQANSGRSADNLQDIQKEQQEVQKTIEGVTELDKAQAKAANEATVWGKSQSAATTVIKEQAEVIPEIIGLLDEYTGSLSINIQAQLENSTALAANRAEQKLISKEIQAAGGATEKQTARLIALKQEELLLADANRELSATIKNQIRDFVSSEGSIDEMRAKLALLQRQYEQLSAAEKKSGLGVSLKSQIDLLDPALKKAEEGIGKAQRSVGGYGNAITRAFSGAFGYLRQIAYILPGIGIAGIMGAISDAVITLVSNLANGADKTAKFAEAQKQLSDQLNISTTALKNQQDALKDDFALLIDSQKSINTIQEKAGQNQFQAFANKKALVKEELDLSNNQLRSTVRQAETDALNAGKRVEGINAVIEAQNIYRDKYRQSVDDQKRLQDELFQHELTIKLSMERIEKNHDLSVSEVEDIGDAVGKARKEIEKNKKLVKSNDELVKSYKERYDVYSTTLKNTAAANTDYNALLAEEQKFNADQQRQIAVESAKIEANIVLAKNQIILSSEKSTLTQRLNAIRSNAAQQKAIAAADLYKVTSDPTKSGTADEVIARKAYAAEISKITAKSRQDQFNENEKYRIKDVEADKQVFEKKKQLQIDQSQELSQTTEFSLQERLTFEKEVFVNQKAIIDKEYQAKKESVKNIYLTDKEKEAIETDYQSKILTLTRTNQTKTTNILSSSLEKQEQLHEESIDKIKRLYEDENLSSLEQYSKDVIELNNSLEAKLINYQQYQNRRRDLDNQYRIDSLRITIAQIQDELTAYTGAEDQFLEAQTRLNNLRASLTSAPDNDSKEKIVKEIDVAQTSYNITKENVERKKALIRELNDAEKSLSDDSLKHDIENLQKRRDVAKEILGKVVDFVNEVKSLSDTLSDARIQQLELEKDALENRYQREQDLINQSYANQVDRDRALLQAKKANAAQKQILDEKEKQENIKKARFDKESAIFSIILNTAKAVVEDLGTPWKIAFDLAIGTAELAIAVAQPLPRYFKGKNVENRENIFTTTTKNIRAADNYEGPAIVDDGEHGKGKAELIVRENGSMEIGTDKPRVTWLHKNDIVYPDAKKAMEKRAEIERLPVKSYVQYLPKFFVGKKADNPIGIAFPATSEKTIWNKELKSNIEKERNVEKENVYSFQKEIKDRVTEPIKLPDVNTLAWQATKAAAETHTYYSTNSSDAQLRSDLRMVGKNIVNAIKNQPKQKRINTQGQLMKLWVSSNKSWGDFFG